jgi:hypothetical protein
MTTKNSAEHASLVVIGGGDKGWRETTKYKARKKAARSEAGRRIDHAKAQRRKETVDDLVQHSRLCAFA